MTNCSVAYLNLADAGTIISSSQKLLAPASRLQDPHVERRWRGNNGDSDYFIIDLLSLQSIDTFGVFGLTLSADGTIRVRASSVDSTGAAGDVYDSGAVAVDTLYNLFVGLMQSAAEARYVRVDLEDAGAEYVEAGRIFVGLREAYAINFKYGWSVQWFDRSTRAKTRGGQTQVRRDNCYRVADLTFDFLPSDQRYDLIENIDRINGLHTDVLMIMQPDAANLAQRTIWGLMTDITPVTQSFFDVFSKQYKIEERL